MSGEFRVDVAALEPGEAGRARVRPQLTVPAGADSGLVRGELASMFARELGRRVGLRLRRLPWGSGVRVVSEDGGIAVKLRGLAIGEQAQLDQLARQAAEECNRKLGPEGESGARLHRILERLDAG